MSATASRPVRPVVTAALLGALVACGGKSRTVPPAEPTIIAFVNNSSDQASVFVSATSGESFRIGSIPPGRTQTITLPARIFASGNTLNFASRPLAGSSIARSGPVTARPGDRFTVTLPPAANTLVVLPGMP